MKVVLSRKGFDSQYGGAPSPILPDGTLLSLPIPSKKDMETKYRDLYYGDSSYYDIIHTLSPNNGIKEEYGCHLDPDIREATRDRPTGWKPAFGQERTALGHLQGQGVGIGDLFLFFGWFRRTEYAAGRLRYKKDAPDWHVIYGYLQVGEIIDTPANIPAWLNGHPHAKAERWSGPNVIYTAASRLSFLPRLSGAGCLRFSDRLVLTKEKCTRRVWDLPDFFRQVPISYNADSWKEDRFISAAKGQEFVFEANDNVLEWVRDIIRQ